MDEIDRITEAEQTLLDARLAQVRRLAQAKAPEVRTCEDCGDIVPPERLRAAPWAKRCITCQELEERH
jgi:DnaK suppressor protein